MLTYLLRDLYGALRFGPVGAAVGLAAFVGLKIWNGERSKKGKPAVPAAPAVGFCVCAAIILAMTLGSRESGGSGSLDLELFSSFGINDRNNAYVVENVLLFLPFGFFGAWNFKRLRNFFACAGTGLLTSLGIETLQYLTRRGIFQIDDILTNGCGMALGWLVFVVWNCVGSIAKK